MGKKKKPFYRVVVADSRAPRDGRFIEIIGTYDPLLKPFVVEIKEDRVFHWLGNGAQPTQTVKSLMKRKGLWLKWDLMKNGADEAKIAEEFAKWEALQAARAERLSNADDAEKAKAAAEAEKKAEEEAKAAEAEAKATEEEAKAAEPEATEAPAEEVKAAETEVSEAPVEETAEVAEEKAKETTEEPKAE